MSGSLEITIDRELCKGHGQCEIVAPEIFELRDDGLAYVMKPDVTEDDLPLIEEAIIRCPTSAIKLRR